MISNQEIIPKGWYIATLGEIAEIIMGQSPTGDSYNFNNDGLPFYQGITDFKDKYVDIKTYTNKPIKIIEKNTILFSVRAPVGKVNITKHKACIGRGNAGLIMKNNIQEFLFYLLKYNEKRFISISTGSVFESISGVELKKVPILIPTSKDEQKEIADILSSFDDKIELLREENKTLEAIASTIFKEWFVNFNFPDENGNPYKSSGGKMIASELGLIPEGWRVCHLQSIFNTIVRGFTTEYVEKSNLINLNQKVNRGDYLEKQYYKYYPRETNVPIDKFAQFGDILINSLGEGTLGRVHFYIEKTDNVVVDQHISILRNTNNVIYREYVYLYLMLRNYRLLNLITGTTGMLMLNINQIRALVIPLPSDTNLELFHKIQLNIFRKKSCNNSQIQTLSTIREQLLPKLMKGELRVKRYERLNE